MYKYKIWGDGISNLTDARYFAARMADWVCLELDPSSDVFLTVAEAVSLAEWIEGPLLAVHTGILDAFAVEALTKNIHVDALKVDRFDVDRFDDWELTDVFYEFSLFPGEDIEVFIDWVASLPANTRGIILNLDKSGLADRTGLEKYLQRIAGEQFTSSLYLCGGLMMKNIDLLDLLPDLDGLCISGGAEEKTGIKSFEDIDMVLDALED